jgi:hypothetical protein
LKKLGASCCLESERNWGKAFRLWKTKKELISLNQYAGNIFFLYFFISLFLFFSRLLANTNFEVVDEFHGHEHSAMDLEYKARKGIGHAIRLAHFGVFFQI